MQQIGHHMAFCRDSLDPSQGLDMEQLGGWRAQRTAELEKLLVKQDLQPLCKKYGIPSSGKKQQLIQRLLDHEAICGT
jgi:hypothetical protein